MKQTGGGRLTPQEERIVNSSAYTDLISKLGVAATGGEARSDSDATSNQTLKAPTDRLQNVLRFNSSSCDSDNTMDGMAVRLSIQYVSYFYNSFLFIILNI